MSREERVDQVEKFQGECQILVSTDAGGEGINLQFCYCMINFDLPWNPARLEQRIGRIDRIGQKHNSLIFNFHLTDTVEDRVRKILKEKLERIKKQFGDDKYADVITFLQDEFSFDRIYIDAIRLKEFENRKLDDMAEEIYDRAKRLLEKDELLVPFTNFNEDASKYLNTEVNKIIKNLVHNFLKYRNIEINWYKDEPQLCYFTNPFHKQNIGPQTYRNITFDNVSSYQSGKTEFINLEHPFVTVLRRKISNAASFGTVSALRLDINKFSGVSGVLFVYKLLIQNNVDKEKIAIISIFLEDEDFCNRRISAYLENFAITDAMIVQNYTCGLDINTYADAALKEAIHLARDRTHQIAVPIICHTSNGKLAFT